MNYSQYQQDVFTHMKNRLGHAAVVSVAGSGKSTTAVEAIGHIPSFFSVLMAAFNTSIRDEFFERGKAKRYKNVRYLTYNGLGWSICLQSNPKALLEPEKTANIFYGLKGVKIEKHLGPVRRIVSLAKSLNIQTSQKLYDQLDHIMVHYCIDEPTEEVFRPTLISVFDLSIRDNDTFDYDDQKHAVIRNGWNIPSYDQVMVDEFQDTCPVEMVLLTEAARGGQFCGLGDPDQSIYGFKGATPDAFAKFVKELNAKELPLSICYRCPTAVIDRAKQIVPRIEAAPGAARGLEETVSKQFFCDNVKAGDFVLCRVTQHLVKECLRFIKLGRSAKVRGRDIGNQLADFIQQVMPYSVPICDFLSRLDDYREKQLAHFRARRQEARITEFLDKHDTVCVLAEGCETSIDMLRKIQEIFCDDKAKHSGIDLMTIHKAKGLQSKTVWILRPDLLPHPRSAGSEWMMEEERRLEYVAVTRAEERLFTVLKAPGER